MKEGEELVHRDLHLRLVDSPGVGVPPPDVGAIVPSSVGEGGVADGVSKATAKVLGAVVWVTVASTYPPLRRRGGGLYLVGKARERWDVMTLCVKIPSMGETQGDHVASGSCLPPMNEPSS